MAQLPRKSAKNAACRSPAWCRTVDIRAQSALGLAEGPTSKASPPHSGLDRLCYKNGPFVSSGLIDRRVPDPQGRVPFIDIIGWVSVQAGKAVAGSYRRNPDHELLTVTAEGFFLLPTTMEGTLDLELRSKCLDTESRTPQVRLNDTEGEERRKLTGILTDQREKPIITSPRSEPAPAGQTAAKRKGWRGWLDRHLQKRLR
jgi:hypothetical protein